MQGSRLPRPQLVASTGYTKLFCLPQGEPFNTSFGVKISRECDVYDLKSLLASMARHDTLVRDVELYRVLIANSGDLERLDLECDAVLLSNRATIGELFPNHPTSPSMV